MLGCNQFSYCFNNPVNLIDSTGGWPTWNDVCAFFEGIVNDVTDFITEKAEAAYDFIEDNLGLSVVSDNELITEYDYRFIYTYTAGTGYSNSFGTEEVLNEYLLIDGLSPSALGIDVNLGGYGGGFQLGEETSVSVRWNAHSYELGLTNTGRLYYQGTYSSDSGMYTFSRLSLNGPEIMVAAVGIYAAGNALIPVLASVAAYSFGR